MHNDLQKLPFRDIWTALLSITQETSTKNGSFLTGCVRGIEIWECQIGGVAARSQWSLVLAWCNERKKERLWWLYAYDLPLFNSSLSTAVSVLLLFCPLGWYYIYYTGSSSTWPWWLCEPAERHKDPSSLLLLHTLSQVSRSRLPLVVVLLWTWAMDEL